MRANCRLLRPPNRSSPVGWIDCVPTYQRVPARGTGGSNPPLSASESQERRVVTRSARTGQHRRAQRPDPLLVSVRSSRSGQAWPLGASRSSWWMPYGGHAPMRTCERSGESMTDPRLMAVTVALLCSCLLVVAGCGSAVTTGTTVTTETAASTETSLATDAARLFPVVVDDKLGFISAQGVLHPKIPLADIPGSHHADPTWDRPRLGGITR